MCPKMYEDTFVSITNHFSRTDPSPNLIIKDSNKNLFETSCGHVHLNVELSKIATLLILEWRESHGSTTFLKILGKCPP